MFNTGVKEQPSQYNDNDDDLVQISKTRLITSKVLGFPNNSTCVSTPRWAITVKACPIHTFVLISQNPYSLTVYMIPIFAAALFHDIETCNYHYKKRVVELALVK